MGGVLRRLEAVDLRLEEVRKNSVSTDSI